MPALSDRSSESLSTDGTRRLLRACNLGERVIKELDFLACVDSVGDLLYSPVLVRLSILRYEHLWLPVCQNALEALNPPLDIAVIQHCHLLSPSRYYADCRNLVGKVPPFNFFKVPSETHFSAGEAAWGRMHPSLPFHINYESFNTAVADMLESLSSVPVLKISPTATPEQVMRMLPASSLSYNLEDAAQRQRGFYYQVSLPHYRDAKFIESAINRYTTFLRIKRSHVKLYPTCDIALVWHSHMTLPHEYKSDTESLLGAVLPHDGALLERSAADELARLQRDTEALFARWGEQLFQCGGMYRGTPARLGLREREALLPEAPVATVELLAMKCKLTETADKKVEIKLKRWKLTASERKLFACFNMDPWTDSDEPLHLLHGEGTKSLNLQGELYTKSTGWVEFTTKCHQTLSVASMMKEGEGTLHLKGWAKMPGGAALARSLVDVGRLRVCLDVAFTRCYCPLLCHVMLPKGALEGRPIPSAASEVSQPGLLLPMQAAHSKGRDTADVVEFHVAMGATRRATLTPLTVKVISTSRYLSSVVEVYAHQGKRPDAPDKKPNRTPCVTAHSVNLAALPHAGILSQGSCCPALKAEECTRAFVIRDSDTDWAVLIGRWEGQTKKGDQGDVGAPGGLEWTLHMVGGGSERCKYTVTPQPNVSADRPKYYRNVSVQLSDGVRGLLHINLVNGTTSFDLLPDERVDVTAKRAGQICALFTALSTCIGILHAWCMPCTRSVKNPEQPEQAMEYVISDTHGNHNKWSSCAWCKPVLASWNAPTNGFVCKRLASQQAWSVHSNPDQSVWKVPGTARMPAAMLPWFSTATAWDTSAIAGRFWGGVQFNTDNIVVSAPDRSIKGGGSASMHSSGSRRGAGDRFALTPRGLMRGLQAAFSGHAAPEMDATILDIGTEGECTEELPGVDAGGHGGCVAANMLVSAEFRAAGRAFNVGRGTGCDGFG